MKNNTLPKIQDVVKNSNSKIKKGLGQNYLFDLNLTDKIVKKSLPLERTIIEIGPGPGSLSRSILKYDVKKLYVIEKDAQSIKMLDSLKKKYSKQLIIINKDILKFPFWLIGSEPRQIIANLPYNISTKLLILILKNLISFNKLTLMFQKEVAQKLVAKSGDKNYGRLSVLMNLLTDTKILFDIPQNAFLPKPKVISTVLEIKPLKKPIYEFDFTKMEKTTHFVFSKKRKMLRSIFKNLGGKKMLEEIHIDPDIRPQNLNEEQFCKLSYKLF